KPLISVDLPEPERVTKLSDVAEDMLQRLAMRDQDSDELWSENLPVYGRLDGKLRDAFVYDAIAWRHLQDARRQWATAVAGEKKGNRRLPQWLYRQQKALECGGPESWQLCEKDSGGCDGAGANTFMGETGVCQRCHGHGYIVG